MWLIFKMAQMKRQRPWKPLFLLLSAGLLWAAFLALLTLCLRGLGTTFPWVLLSALIAAWGVWTVVIARSLRRPAPVESPEREQAAPVSAVVTVGTSR